ncbi:MAG: hydantoinase/oxoprolinase family protein [Phycisphaeraceae bacterium]
MTTPPKPPFRIGVDTGGTFTDLILTDQHGTIRATHKLLSTPDDPARAVLEGIRALLASLEQSVEALSGVVHGSTVATNALLEGNTARAALVTTQGFEDLLLIARQNRPALYDLVPQKQSPVIPRDLTLGASQRTACDGQTIAPLKPKAVAKLIDQLRQLKPEAIAISLLHSYANPDDERTLADAINTAFNHTIHLTVSHQLLPELREYERTATCAINAAVAPRMNGYVKRLADTLGDDRLTIMASHAGTLSVDEVADQPVRTILSGPAGGALGALAVAKALGHPRIITFDMGGTSTDVALLDTAVTLTTEGTAADMPVRLPMVDLHTVGAGGGSIAWIDPGGALRVGPKSCGADPGPACYGRQPRDNPQPAVTDAHAVLGNLHPDTRLAGSMPLDLDAANHAVDHLAKQLNLTRQQTAEGILTIAESTMARAIRKVSLERGHDPREYAMVSFGGAGGLHACRLAQALGITTIIAPAHAGLLSAVGMLTAPRSLTFSTSIIHSLSKDEISTARQPNQWPASLFPQAFDHLNTLASAWFSKHRIPQNQQHTRLQADLRYAGQSFEITTDIAQQDPVAAFEREHRRLYGYTPDDRPIEVVTLRLLATTEDHPLIFPPSDPPTPTTELIGPATLRNRSSTLLIREGWKATTTPESHTLLQPAGALA